MFGEPENLQELTADALSDTPGLYTEGKLPAASEARVFGYQDTEEIREVLEEGECVFIPASNDKYWGVMLITPTEEHRFNDKKFKAAKKTTTVDGQPIDRADTIAYAELLKQFDHLKDAEILSEKEIGERLDTLEAVEGTELFAQEIGNF